MRRGLFVLHEQYTGFFIFNSSASLQFAPVGLLVCLYIINFMYSLVSRKRVDMFYGKAPKS